MKKNSGYMTRALKANDPRFARILGKLGYDEPKIDEEHRDEKPSDDKPKKKAKRRKKKPTS